MNKVVHFEIPFEDKARVEKFYTEVFGWKLFTMDMPQGDSYLMAQTVEVDQNRVPVTPGAINGGFMPKANVPQTVIALEVDSVDEHLKKIEAAGGSIVMPKIKVGEMGYYAYVKDSEGNTIGIWENIKPNA